MSLSCVSIVDVIQILSSFNGQIKELFRIFTFEDNYWTIYFLKEMSEVP